jgi:hypothetical protein
LLSSGELTILLTDLALDMLLELLAFAIDLNLFVEDQGVQEFLLLKPTTGLQISPERLGERNSGKQLLRCL